MKQINFFLITAFSLVGCQNQEELDDFDGNFQQSDESDICHLAEDPAPSPYELLMKETSMAEGQDPVLLNFY